MCKNILFFVQFFMIFGAKSTKKASRGRLNNELIYISFGARLRLSLLFTSASDDISIYPPYTEGH